MGIKGSNIQGPAGNRANNGFLPLTKGGSTVHPSNVGPGGDKRNGSFPLGASGGLGVTPPNDSQFRNGDRGMTPHSGAAVEPGKGLIPVEPGGSTALKISDMSPPKAGR
jgi:hypothetical protein